jgi:hypothetical protein
VAPRPTMLSSGGAVAGISARVDEQIPA